MRFDKIAVRAHGVIGLEEAEAVCIDLQPSDTDESENGFAMPKDPCFEHIDQAMDEAFRVHERR